MQTTILLFIASLFITKILCVYDVWIQLSAPSLGGTDLSFSIGLDTFVLDDPTVDDADGVGNNKVFLGRPSLVSEVITLTTVPALPLQAIHCKSSLEPDSVFTVDLVARTVNFTPLDNDDIICQYDFETETVLPAGTIVMRLINNDPAVSPPAIGFTTTLLSPPFFILDTNPATATLSWRQFKDITPGSYPMNAVVPTGRYNITGFCVSSDPGDDSVAVKQNFMINLDDGETIFCTLKLNRIGLTPVVPSTEAGSVTVTLNQASILGATTDNSVFTLTSGLSSATFALDDPAADDLDGVGNTFSFSLPPGTHTVSAVSFPVGTGSIETVASSLAGDLSSFAGTTATLDLQSGENIIVAYNLNP